MNQAPGCRYPFFIEVIKDAQKKVKKEIKDSSKAQLEPRQGHHIINKGVVDIYEDIIRYFVRDFKYNYIFKGESYEDLKTMDKIIDKNEKEALEFLFVDNPLSKKSVDFILGETVPANGRINNSRNDEHFSRAKLVLIACVNLQMFEIYEMHRFDDMNEAPRCEPHFLQLRNVIDDYFSPTTPKCAYVDQQAYRWWIGVRGFRNVIKFKKCKKEVQKMLECIAKGEEQEGEQTFDVKQLLAYNWGKGAFLIEKALE